MHAVSRFDFVNITYEVILIKRKPVTAKFSQNTLYLLSQASTVLAQGFPNRVKEIGRISLLRREYETLLMGCPCQAVRI